METEKDLKNYKFSELYQQLKNIDINKEGYIEWKDVGNGIHLGYLQWAIADELFLTVYDEFDFIIKDFGNGKNYYADETGAYVETTIIARKGNQEWKKTQQLQILDDSNFQMKLEPYEKQTKKGIKTIDAFTMADVENTIQRCKVKTYHQFGLASQLYQGKIKSPKPENDNQPVLTQGKPVPLDQINQLLLQTNSNLTSQDIINYFTPKKWLTKKGQQITINVIKYYITNGLIGRQPKPITAVGNADRIW